MKNTISSLELLLFVKQNSRTLKGSRIQKVFARDDVFVLETFKRNFGRNFLYSLPGYGLFISKKKLFESEGVDKVQKLRKELKHKTINEVKQHEFERILEIKANGVRLILEFFGKGNLIIEKNGKVVFALIQRGWRHRKVRVGFPYEYPPPLANPLKVTLNQLKQIVGKKEIVKVLARDLSLGGEIAEKVCKELKINKNKKCLSEEEISKLYEFLKNLDKNFERKYGDVNEVLKNRIMPIIQKKLEEKERAIKEKVKKIEERRKKAIEELKKSIELNRRIGELIKNNYTIVEKALKSGKTSIEIENIEIKLDPKKSVFQNAQVYFEKAKKAKKKLERILKSKVEVKLEAEKPKEEKERKKWYEKFRWFKSSDGFLVVAGKDAKSNELLIRKYMKPNDIVFHADITGSPFVLVKNGKDSPKTTLKEAAEFCAAYSKAWKVGIGVIDVYWVYPEQVSKKAPAGEYLTKGAFMIYGKKNWIRRVEVKLGVGKTKEGELISGPPSLVSKKTKMYVTIAPGNLDAKQLREKLKEMGILIDLDELQKILPYGRGDVIQ